MCEVKRARLPVDLTAASALSVAGHVAIALGFVMLVRYADFGSSSTDSDALGDDAIELVEDDAVALDLEAIGEPNAELAENANPVTPPDVAPRGDKDPRPDSGARGKGGDDDVKAPALNLADRAEDVSLERSVLSRIDRSQLPRIRSNARSRSSREDWRASRDPMEVTFFSVGPGEKTFERREHAKTDPGHGAPAATQRDSQGMELGMQIAVVDDGFMARKRAGSNTPGGKTSSPGVGTRSSTNPLGPEATQANVAKNLPMVDRATPSVFANQQGKPADDEDSEQEVQARLQSIVHASTPGGAAGAGKGGSRGASAPGSGGTLGAGSTSSPMGSGGTGAPDPADPARVGYLRAMAAKIQPLWKDAFPMHAALSGDQGTAIITVVIDASGAVVSATVTRESGVAEFDANVRQAVVQGGSYGPLPELLRPTLTVRLSFVAKNPAVRPNDPGEGVRD